VVTVVSLTRSFCCCTVVDFIQYCSGECVCG